MLTESRVSTDRRSARTFDINLEWLLGMACGEREREGESIVQPAENGKGRTYSGKLGGRFGEWASFKKGRAKCMQRCLGAKKEIAHTLM